MQFIPGVENIWVLKLNPEDPIYEFDNEEEAQEKAKEFEESDSEGRKYRVVNMT